MAIIAANLQAVRDRIRVAARAAGRDEREVTLLAVSKTWPVEALRDAWSAGQLVFGENYAQEGVKKAGRLAGLGIEWHFIGPVQSNKTAIIAETFAWVHTIDRLKIAERLAAARKDRAPLNVCVQVNVSGESSKSGVPPGAVAELARAVAQLPNLKLRGLMTIPESGVDTARTLETFQTLRDLKNTLAGQGLALDTLSMGMSHDLESAIAAGATMVRVGTAIFGERAKGAA